MGSQKVNLCDIVAVLLLGSAGSAKSSITCNLQRVYSNGLTCVTHAAGWICVRRSIAVRPKWQILFISWKPGCRRTSSVRSRW
jgi:hypothetical protein